MSGQEFHAHGAHEHAVEHQAHNRVGLAQYIAIFTAVLSTIAAIVSYQGAAMQNEAMLLKDEAVIKQTQAADAWSFYQAKSNKGHIMELASALVDPSKAQSYREQGKRYQIEKDQIKAQAEGLEAFSRAFDAKSSRLMAKHHQQAQAMMLLQIAISLASITVLTRKLWLFVIAGVAAVGGSVLAIIAFF